MKKSIKMQIHLLSNQEQVVKDISIKTFWEFVSTRLSIQKDNTFKFKDAQSNIFYIRLLACSEAAFKFNFTLRKLKYI